MRLLPQTTVIFLPLLLSTTVSAQAAQGGGAPAPPPPSQYPTVSNCPSLTTDANGVVTTVWLTFTQTFASTALGSWALGPTPMAGTIGL